MFRAIKIWNKRGVNYIKFWMKPFISRQIQVIQTKTSFQVDAYKSLSYWLTLFSSTLATSIMTLQL